MKFLILIILVMFGLHFHCEYTYKPDPVQVDTRMPIMRKPTRTKKKEKTLTLPEALEQAEEEAEAWDNYGIFGAS